jgi:GT2 family glycosyltransferase
LIVTISLKASVLILTKDRPFLIKSCLESLQRTVDPEAVEILVGDTGSSDPAVFRFYETFGKAFPGRFEVKTFPKYHFSTNNNELTELARGEHFIFLNNDTVAQSGWLPPLLTLLERSEIGIVGAKLLYPNSGRIQHAGVEFLKEGRYKYLGYHVLHRRHSLLPDSSIENFVPAVTGACLGIKRAVFLAVGGFDPVYHEECQDADLCLKARKAGFRTAFSPKSVLYHLENGTRTVAEDSRDRSFFIKRWRSFIDEEFFSRKLQSRPVNEELAHQRESARQVCFVRERARGDVFAFTVWIKKYKEAHPRSHVTYKTDYPELVDALPFIDRVLSTQDYDELKYDAVFQPKYETGEWAREAHPWLVEMGRSVGLQAPSEALRPMVQFSERDQQTRDFYRKFAKTNPYVVVATGAGWKEREWSPEEWENLAQAIQDRGKTVFQIGGPGDYLISSALHCLERDLHDNLAILESAKAMVTLDSFPYHLGLAVGLPLVLLTCKTCRHTLYVPDHVTQLRNRLAETTPLPGCREFGCRQKFGEGNENLCLEPILRTLSHEKVMEALLPYLGPNKGKTGTTAKEKRAHA